MLAFDHRVVVAVAPPAHAAHDPVRGEPTLVVFRGIRAAAIGMMEQPGLGAPPLQGHLERREGQPAIIDGANGPAHDEARAEVHDDRLSLLKLRTHCGD